MVRVTGARTAGAVTDLVTVSSSLSLSLLELLELSAGLGVVLTGVANMEDVFVEVQSKVRHDYVF